MTQEQTIELIPQEPKVAPFLNQPECLEDYSKHFLRCAPEKLIKERMDVFISKKENREFAEILKLKYQQGHSLTWIAKQSQFSCSTRWIIFKHRQALEKFYLYLPRSWQNAE